MRRLVRKHANRKVRQMTKTIRVIPCLFEADVLELLDIRSAEPRFMESGSDEADSGEAGARSCSDAPEPPTPANPPAAADPVGGTR